MTDKERIESIEKILNLTTNALAKEIGLKNAQTLYDILKGKHGISKDLADKIAVKYLNINKAWLITGEGDMLKEQQQIGDVKNSTIVNGNVNGNGNKITHYTPEYENCQKEVEHLKAIIDEKDKIIAEKEQRLIEKNSLISEKERMIKLLLKEKE
ncbi:MAG: helix-turn-helix transcriptional regulator [Rikenellaceae bacterium]